MGKHFISGTQRRTDKFNISTSLISSIHLKLPKLLNMIAIRGLTVLCILGVLLVGFSVQSEAAPDCSCEWRGIGVLGCTIEVAPPPGYRCHCTNWRLWCSGDAIRCVDPKHPSCRGCKEQECCSGDC